MKELTLRCEQCGGGLTLKKENCEYCGSLNPNYIIWRETKPLELKDWTHTQASFGIVLDNRRYVSPFMKFD